MKNPKTGDLITWNGELAKIIGEANSKTVIIEMMDNSKCPHCGKSLGKEQFSIIPTYHLFQECAMPVQTMDI